MVLPDGYVMATPVTVTVTVMAVEDPTITAIKVPVTETYFTKGVVTEPKFYTCDGSGGGHPVPDPCPRDPGQEGRAPEGVL